jgi:hypothetical protein
MTAAHPTPQLILVMLASAVLVAACGEDEETVVSSEAVVRDPESGIPLGRVTVPSGELRILDCGMLRGVEDGSLAAVPAVRVDGVPRDALLEVLGHPDDSSEFEGDWASVSLLCRPGLPIARSETAGKVAVDWARLMLVDGKALATWKHEESLDGKADFVFWGREAEALAQATGADDLGDGTFGWQNRSIDECVGLAARAEEMKKARGLRLATDFRPHSHHFIALEKVRRSPTSSASLTVGGADLCVFTTPRGDGTYPVLIDLSEDATLVRVRILLGEEQGE